MSSLIAAFDTIRDPLLIFLIVLFVGATFSVLWSLRFVHRLPDHFPAQENASPLPSVTVVIASRDDDSGIERTIKGLFNQQGVQLRVVLVDDRSTPHSASHLAQLAEDEPRLELIRIDHLPDGWLGKCHALHQGTKHLDSEWTLFCDGDAWMSDDLVLRAIHALENEGADHGCLVPADRGIRFTGKAMHLAMLAGFLGQAALANRDSKLGVVGVGAFNLVRTAAYQQIGRHEPLRLQIIDDAYLGLLLKRAGFKTRCYIGFPDLTVRWASTPLDYAKALEKNAFAMLGYRTWFAFALFIFGISLFALTFSAPWWGGKLGLAVIAAWYSSALGGVLTARRFGWSAWPSLLVPWFKPFGLYILLRSTWTTLKQGGVQWRDTFYPLSQLRKEEPLSLK